LRLIAASGLADGGVEKLAEHLGVGSRHLRRLFLRHLGATPSAVAQTRRLHFAKKLLDETNLSMGDIAVAAGFGCVRRFNATIRQVYKRTPTEIRRLARPTEITPRNQYLFRLPYRPPYDWDRMLAFLAPRATPGVEAVEAGTYRRTISVAGSHGWLEVSRAEGTALAVRLQFGDPSVLFQITERIRAMFDLNADWAAIARVLAADPVLAARLKARPGLRVPGCWNGFELAVRAILGQQIAVKAATTLAGRLAKALGQSFAGPMGLTNLFASPETLAEKPLADIGLTGKRAEAIRRLAGAVAEGRICFEGPTDSGILLARLREIPGIGPWTAQYIAMRALGEPDAFPCADLGLRHALNLGSARELQQRAEVWRPWRAYAAMYLWSSETGKESR
jgi:AraC family transcriptional regulator of adaptative response / DNA-3-methyladenine glycosylase II